MRDASGIRTGKLYEEDAYAREFEAEVIRAEGRELVLDRTLFFPEEGGQSPDHGEIGGVRVVDVQIRDGEIIHTMERADAFSAGERVRGRIDWEERFSNMQQHSGEHLFSGAVFRRYGFSNVGFHLSGKEVTLDFDGEIPAEDLPEIVREVNGAIWADIPSQVLVTTPEEREGLAYRSKLDLPGEVRIVVFPGADACACCAPHVRRTGEIGFLMVTGMIRWKSGVRVSILCGDRALRQAAEEHRIVTETARYLSTSPSEIYPQTVKAREENRRLRGALSQVSGELLLVKAEALPEGEDAWLFAEGADAADLRTAVNGMMERRRGFCGAFSGSDGEGYSFVIGSAEKDAREVMRILKEKLGARGGGKPGMVQGSVQAAESGIRSALSEV
ncbi:MAG: hypothetical protein IJJ38_04105 [Lachnospiraceae bacterium]|nr:hypothetical protein [Lachnospiraceae bacterium]